MTPAVPSSAPIFVLGILERSGTNYLRALLLCHPDCTTRHPIAEDSLLRYAHLLVGYVDAVSRRWDPRWGAGEAERRQLLSALGAGLTGFLTGGSDGRRVVTKTPSVDNLEQFFDLFPDSPLIVTVRDGRNVVESGVRSFGWSYTWAMRTWAAAGRRILAFEADHRDDPRFRVVRYEQLVADPVGTIRPVLAGCGLDPDRYDERLATTDMVFGSSDVLAGERPLHWDPVPPPPGFDPLTRFRDWPARRHRQFAALAGDVQTALGYPLDASPAGGLGRLAYRAAARADELSRAGRRRLAGQPPPPPHVSRPGTGVAGD
jgi:hypothetical protein